MSLKQDLLGFIVSFSIQLVSWLLLLGFCNAVATQRGGGGGG